MMLLFFLFNWNPSYVNLFKYPAFFIGCRLLHARFSFILSWVSQCIYFLFIFQRYQIHMPLNHYITREALFAGTSIGVGLGIIFRYGVERMGYIIAILAKKIFWLEHGGSHVYVRCLCHIDFFSFLFNLSRSHYTLVAVFLASRYRLYERRGILSTRSDGYL